MYLIITISFTAFTALFIPYHNHLFNLFTFKYFAFMTLYLVFLLQLKMNKVITLAFSPNYLGLVNEVITILCKINFLRIR